MSKELQAQRLHRLRKAMDQAGLDTLVIAGDAWRSDYLRFALDVTPMEGSVVARIDGKGRARVWADHPAEARRLAAQYPDIDVDWAAQPAAALVAGLPQDTRRCGLVPASTAPHALAGGSLGATLASTTGLLDGLMVRKTPEEADAVERAVELADAAEHALARLAGAEEVTLHVAPDLHADATGLRLEDALSLGASYGLVLSVAYKGVWVRQARSIAVSAGGATGPTGSTPPAPWSAAQQWFAQALASLTTLRDGLPPPPAEVGALGAWTLEASVDARPLSAIDSDRSPAIPALPDGTLAVLTVQLQLADGSHWLHGAPLRVAAGSAALLATT